MVNLGSCRQPDLVHEHVTQVATMPVTEEHNGDAMAVIGTNGSCRQGLTCRQVALHSGMHQFQEGSRSAGKFVVVMEIDDWGG